MKNTYKLGIRHGYKKAAEAGLKEGTACKDRFSVTAVGNPLLMAGDAYTMPAIEPEYAGAWSIQNVENTLDKNGFIDNLSLERPQ